MSSLEGDPIDELRALQAQALERADPLARRLFLATVQDGRPGLRTLVLRRIDRGLCVLIHASSPKWRALQSGGYEALILWSSISLQMRMRGGLERLGEAELRELWSAKSREAQILDHAYESLPQSAVLDDRGAVLAAVEDARRSLAGRDEIPPAEGSLGLRFIPEHIDDWRSSEPGPPRRRRRSRGPQGWTQVDLNP